HRSSRVDTPSSYMSHARRQSGLDTPRHVAITLPMRIIAGALGGRRLVAPRGLGTRPTADKVKEAMFSILGPPVAHPFRVLDVYAGSGALGLEALSRGADSAVLVENHRQALDALERNVGALDVADRVRVVEVEA